MLPLAFFKKVQSFIGNLFIFSKKQQKIEKSEKTANFSCIPQQNCYIQSFQSEIIFLENPCALITAKVWTFWEMLLFQLKSTAKLLPLASFYNFMFFVRKTHFLFLKRPEVWTFWGLLPFQSILQQVCCFCHFRRLQFFSKNRSILYYFKIPKFERFEKPYEFLSFVQQFCYHQRLLKTSRFSPENPSFYAKNQLLNVLRKLTVPFAFDIKLAICFSRSRHQNG